MNGKIKKIWKQVLRQYEIIKYPTVFTLVVLTTCFVSVRVLQNQIGVIERIIFYILTYIGAQNIKSVISEIKVQFTCVFDKIILTVICLTATFFETGAFYLEPIYSNPIPSVPFFALSATWISVIVLYIICKGQRLIERLICNREEKGFSLKANLIMVAVCVGLCMLCTYAFNPAITSPDSQYCYNYAFHLGEEPIANGHPIFYILLLKLCTLINPTIQFMILVQATYYSLVYTYAMNALVEIGVSKKTCVALYFFVGISFSSIIQLATLWKDIPFAASLVWLTTLLIKMCANQEKYSKNFCWYLQYVISLVMTALIRHNGVLPVAATVVLVLLLLKEKRKMILATFVSISFILIINGPVYRYYQVYEIPGLKFYAMANDIMYLYYHGGIDDDKIMQVVNDATDGDPENFQYNAYYTKIARNNMDHYSVAEFLDIYLYAWYTYPKTMLKGFLARNSMAWSVDRTYYESGGCANYLGEYHDPSFEEQYPNRKSNVITYIASEVFNKLTSIKLVYTLYWKTAIYNLLMIIGILITIIRFKKKFLVMILPYIPIAVNVIALLMTSGWPDYRYYWPSMLTASILLPYTLIILKKHDNFVFT